MRYHMWLTSVLIMPFNPFKRSSVYSIEAELQCFSTVKHANLQVGTKIHLLANPTLRANT